MLKLLSPEPGFGGLDRKRALGRAGVRDLGRYGADSLPAGFATTAFDNVVPEFENPAADRP